MGARRPQATVSGPGIDRSYEAPSVALSAAITLATRAEGEITLYVRRPDESIYGRVERTLDGFILVHRTYLNGTRPSGVVWEKA